MSGARFDMCQLQRIKNASCAEQNTNTNIKEIEQVVRRLSDSDSHNEINMTTTTTQNNKMLRTVSLTDPEATVMKALLFGPNQDSPLPTNELTADMVLQCPDRDILQQSSLRNSKRRNREVGTLQGLDRRKPSPRIVEEKKEEQPREKAPKARDPANPGSVTSSENEVRGDGDSLSWGSADSEGEGHYDAWEVLRDEYASEFGFDYTSRSLDDTSDLVDSFQILGTSSSDSTTRPHVLSPPMMDALLRFVPDSISADNFWLRYSSVRDGASLATLQRYVRAAQHTIVAIETTGGHVFGSYTSTPWRNHYGFYGSLPAFVWKLRHSRQTRCASLYDQAQMETELDVYMTLDANEQEQQLCRHDMLGIGRGGGDDMNKNSGMAFMVDEDLDRGTSEFCLAFRSPCLAEVETFRIVNMEVWSFTPCETVGAAESLELRQYALVEQDDDALSRSTDEFYLRVGEDFESQARRDRWQYLNMMNTETSLGSSPKL